MITTNLNTRVEPTPLTSCILSVRQTVKNTNIYKELAFSAGLSHAASAGAMAPVIYFAGALIYSAGFNVNQNFKKKKYF
jgi:hypothetical protein